MRRLCTTGPLLLAVLLAGCGGSSPAHNAAATERSEEAKAEAQLAQFARCMREHGVPAEVVNSPGEGHGLKVGPSKEGRGGGPNASAGAEKACARYRPRPKHVDLSPQQKVEREEAVQKFARCMREHGIEVQASAKEGGIQIGIQSHPGGGGPNPDSPAFQRAQSTCQKLLPKDGPGRAPGPGSSVAGG